MGKTQWLYALATALALTGCGGGGADTGTSPFPNGTTGTGGSTTASAAADLDLVLSKTSASDSGSDSVAVTVTAVDASRVALAGIPISVGANNGAVVVSGAAVTNTQGQLSANVTTGTDKSNRTVTVTATSGALTKTATFAVTGAKLQATLNPLVVAPGTTGQIRYQVSDTTSLPISGAAISVSAPGLTAGQGTTDSNGEYLYSYTAPSTGGSVAVTANAAGVTLVQTLVVQAGGSTTIPSATAGSVQSASVSLDKSVVSVTTGERVEVRALFLGSANSPVQNVRVRFDLGGDPNSIGGSITSGTNLVYSDATGVATAAYAPGSRSSPTDGVTVRACWDYTDFAVGTCPHAASKTLTVTSEALSVSIGYDNSLLEGSSGLTYIKQYVVTVNDAAGVAKSDVLITPSIDLINYVKGQYAGPGAWALTPGSGQTCANEDLNRNGVNEAGEDFNSNGQLEPRKSQVLISMVGSNRSSASGLAILQIEYPKNVATWIDFKIMVTASGVSGTEGRATVSGRLRATAADFKLDSPPAWATSPFGVSGGTPIVVTPTGGTPITVCTDPS